MFECDEEFCAICRIRFDDSTINDAKVSMSQKGVETLLQYSELHGDEELAQCLRGRPSIVYVHCNCRKKYTSKKFRESQKRHAPIEESAVAPKVTRSTVPITFDWKQHCFFCCRPDRRDTSVVMTLPFRSTLMEICCKRKDALATAVLGRLETCCDLVAAEAFYHRPCYQAFVLKPTPSALSNDVAPKTGSINVRVGRPVDPEMSNVFEKLCSWLEVSDDNLYTLEELQNKMSNLSNNPKLVYSSKQLKRKLEDKYGEHIFFSEINGHKNVVGFKDMVSSIITNKWYTERKADFVEESRRIVTAAAKLIKAEIRDCLFNNADYPLTSDFSNVQAAKDWIPGLLKEFIENVVGTELKQVAICHSIVQAARPRSVISPVLFGVGVSLDHAFGSRWVLDMLSRLGYSVSYDEVNLYKQSVVQNQSPDFPQSHPDSFTQWSGDNVDHNKLGSPKTELIHIRAIRNSIGDAAAGQILVAHAISGCDTTSSLYGLGKVSVWKKITCSSKTLPLTSILSSGDATHDDVSSAGLKLLTLLYGGKSSDTLNHLRYLQYMNKSASCYAQPRPERLPPTQNAATYHVYRAHLQIVQWQTLMTTNIQPTDWGWKLSNDRYVPILTDLEPAPDELLNVVRCKCRVEVQRPCSNKLCSCVKHGLSCVAACKNCYGDQCDNVAETDYVHNKDNDDSCSEEESKVTGLEDIIPEDCLLFDIPWLDEEEVECQV